LHKDHLHKKKEVFYAFSPFEKMVQIKQIKKTFITAAHLCPSEVNRAVQLYITQEINPVIQRTVNMANTATQQSRLGILYARAG